MIRGEAKARARSGDMADVFISYKSERVEAVEHLAATIEAHGYSVWYDIRGLETGPSFGPQIEAALRDAQLVLVLWCSLSKTSEWVLEEAHLAKALGKYAPAHMEPDCRPPLGFQLGQALQLQGWTGNPDDEALDPLFDFLENKLGREATTSRRRMREISRAWALRGSRNFVGERTRSDVPTETTVARQFPASPTSPRFPVAPESVQIEEVETVQAAIVRPPTDSEMAWAEVSGSGDLQKYDAFLRTFPNAPEADACRAERIVEARSAAFEALPRDGYDLRPFDAFLEAYPNSYPAFQAATMRSACETRIRESAPLDNATREAWELEAAVAILTGQPIPPARQPHLQDLSLSGWDDDLFEALKSAGVRFSDIYEDPEAQHWDRRLKHADLSPLQSFVNLQTLDCAGTHVSDLSPLQGLANLLVLDCGRTAVANISPLQGLANLQTLSCARTQVADLSALQGLANLQRLYCYNTQVSDLSPLQGLANLQELDCDSTPISDLFPLQGLANLRELNCEGTKVSDWSPVDHVDFVSGRPDDWPRKGAA